MCNAQHAFLSHRQKPVQWFLYVWRKGPCIPGYTWHRRPAPHSPSRYGAGPSLRSFSSGCINAGWDIGHRFSGRYGIPGIRHVTVLVTGGMGLIGEAPLMLPFVEYPTLRICGGHCYGFLLFCRFLSPGLLLFGGIVPFPPSGFGRFIPIIQWLFSMSLPVRVHLCQQLLLVSFCRCRYFLLHFLLQICTGFDVCPIYKYHFYFIYCKKSAQKQIFSTSCGFSFRGSLFCG